MQAAQSVSQVFLGINLKCASCHDSFVNDWSLADAYGMAALFSEKELELVHCDKPTGKKAALRFLYPQLGGVDAGSGRARAAAAQLAAVHDRARGWPPFAHAGESALGAACSAAGWWSRRMTWTSRRGRPSCSTGWPRISSRTVTMCATRSRRS